MDSSKVVRIGEIKGVSLQRMGENLVEMLKLEDNHETFELKALKSERRKIGVYDSNDELLAVLRKSRSGFYTLEPKERLPDGMPLRRLNPNYVPEEEVRVSIYG